MLNIIKCTKQLVALRVGWVEFDLLKEFPGWQRAHDGDFLRNNKVVAKSIDSFDLAFESTGVMKILLLVEFFELVIKYLCLSNVAFHW